MRTARRTSVCASLADQLAESMTIKTPGIPLLTVAGPSPAPTPTPSIDDGTIDHAFDNSPASSPAMSDYSLFSERSCTSSNATSLALRESKAEDVCMMTLDPVRHAASTPLRHLGTLSFASSAAHGQQQHTPQNVKVYLASTSNIPTPSTSLPISRFVARRNALAPGNGPYTPSSCGPTRQTKGNRTARTAYMSSHLSVPIPVRPSSPPPRRSPGSAIPPTLEVPPRRQSAPHLSMGMPNRLYSNSNQHTSSPSTSDDDLDFHCRGGGSGPSTPVTPVRPNLRRSLAARTLKYNDPASASALGTRRGRTIPTLRLM